MRRHSHSDLTGSRQRRNSQPPPPVSQKTVLQCRQGRGTASTDIVIDTMCMLAISLLSHYETINILTIWTVRLYEGPFKIRQLFQGIRDLTVLSFPGGPAEQK